jgi:hypothetical protein
VNETCLPVANVVLEEVDSWRIAGPWSRAVQGRAASRPTIVVLGLCHLRITAPALYAGLHILLWHSHCIDEVQILFPAPEFVKVLLLQKETAVVMTAGGSTTWG